MHNLDIGMHFMQPPAPSFKVVTLGWILKIPLGHNPSGVKRDGNTCSANRVGQAACVHGK